MKSWFVPQLESLRGVAALLVVAFHAWQIAYILPGAAKVTSIPAITGDPDPFWNAVTVLHRYVVGSNAGRIHPAVLLFFVLSGFVLAGLLKRDGDPVRFLVARLFRLMPAIWVNLLGLSLLWWLFGLRIGRDPYTLETLWQNAVLLSTGINGVLWTLRNELLAMPVIYAAFLFHRRFGTPYLVLVTVLLAAVTPWDPVRSALGLDPHYGWMWAFLLGMCVFHVGQKLCCTLRPRTASALFSFAVTAFFFCTVVIPVPSYLRQITEILSAGTMVGLLAYGPPTAWSRLLDAAPLRFYGRISYSLYLWHAVIMTVTLHRPVLFGRIIAGGMPPIAVALMVTVAAIVVATPLAWLSYSFVERPGIAAGRRVLARFGGRTAAPIPSSTPAPAAAQ